MILYNERDYGKDWEFAEDSLALGSMSAEDSLEAWHEKRKSDDSRKLELLAVLKGAITEEFLFSLTSRQRDSFTMTYYQGMSLTEIGEKLGCTPQSVAEHVHRVEDKLRSIVELDVENGGPEG